MFDRMLRVVIGLPVVALLLWMSVGSPSMVQAEHSTITQMDVRPLFINAQGTQGVALSSSGVIYSSVFRTLEKTQNQTVQIQASGASPNYTVELLITLERDVFTSPATVTFTKPEVGGTLYTFTDALVHVFPIYSPACLGNELRVTGLGGGAVQGNISGLELSQ